MIVRARLALVGRRLLLAGVGSAALGLCVFMPGTSAAFSAASLTGRYGCVGHGLINDNSGTLTGISELLRLAFNGAGGVSAKIILNLQGEVCTITGVGTYTVSGGGLGSMSIPWTSATGDQDGDANCFNLIRITFYGRASHAALAPWTGASALAAIIQLFQRGHGPARLRSARAALDPQPSRGPAGARDLPALSRARELALAKDELDRQGLVSKARAVIGQPSHWSEVSFPPETLRRSALH
jgi:hypothetical protein